MITRKEIIQTDEYWEEIVFNALWRVETKHSTIKKETNRLCKQISELRNALNTNALEKRKEREENLKRN
jgi:hypothetical protein